MQCLSLGFLMVNIGKKACSDFLNLRDNSAGKQQQFFFFLNQKRQRADRQTSKRTRESRKVDHFA